jgi:four helix bundle protein
MGNETATKIANYRDLKVFQRSYELALKIHRITQKFPVFERRELGSQLRRAATSIPINIAEGYGRKRSTDDFKRFLVIAMGSSNEVSVELALARDLGYLDAKTHQELESECDQIGRMINKLIQVWR